MNLSSPMRDLEIATSEIEKMKLTNNFDEFREAWENFLFRIERAWELTERTLRGKKGSCEWQKPYTELRKKDSLLVFLKQARNSEMHSISSTLSKPLKMVVKDKTGHGLSINSISAMLEKGTLTINIDSTDIVPSVEVSIVPTNPELVRIQNRGKWYNPPWSHLKERLSDLHPVSIALMGLDFYKAYVREAKNWMES